MSALPKRVMFLDKCIALSNQVNNILLCSVAKKSSNVLQQWPLHNLVRCPLVHTRGSATKRVKKSLFLLADGGATSR